MALLLSCFILFHKIPNLIKITIKIYQSCVADSLYTQALRVLLF
ncbi:hypothetical protein P20652_2282 [Pseudoalteromonas sp. BSi20652]|nr:hypothetical protein P20652_2282 [Pseudoalteromonas sp. BSi20652]